MDFDHIHDLHRLLSHQRQPISKQQLMAELEISWSTLKRIIRYMREVLEAPILNNPQGYFYGRDLAGQYELPGIWFSSNELEALLAIYHLIHKLDNPLLDKTLEPLSQRIIRLLGHKNINTRHINRIRIIAQGNRQLADKVLPRCTEAILQRQQLLFDYHARGKDSLSHRTISPQHLVHYRDNWYLDGWCHDRQALRTFSLDAMSNAILQEEKAIDVDDTNLEQELASSYGIFSGIADQKAVIHFSPYRAHWVASECWHPQQQSQWLEDGGYELILPYHHTEELLMDILKYGPDAQVISPPELRCQVQNHLKLALKHYE